MTRYLTKPKSALRVSSSAPEEQPNNPGKDVAAKPKRGKKQAPVEEDVLSASSFASSSTEPDSLRNMGFTGSGSGQSLQSRDQTAIPNKESNAAGSAIPSQKQSSAISDTSRSRSATTRRSMPVSIVPPPGRPATQSRRKSNSPVRRKSSSPVRRRHTERVCEEIRLLQNRTDLVIPKLPFSRLIREALQEYSEREMRVTAECLNCLQEASEIYLTQLLEDSWRCTRHRDRATLTPKDLRLALMLRNDSVLM